MLSTYHPKTWVYGGHSRLKAWQFNCLLKDISILRLHFDFVFFLEPQKKCQVSMRSLCG